MQKSLIVSLDSVSAVPPLSDNNLANFSSISIEISALTPTEAWLYLLIYLRSLRTHSIRTSQLFPIIGSTIQPIWTPTLKPSFILRGQSMVSHLSIYLRGTILKIIADRSYRGAFLGKSASLLNQENSMN